MLSRASHRYFASKEDMVLELYLWLVARLEDEVRHLPAASIADRFRHLMAALLGEMAPHRLTLVALSGAALNPFSRAGVFGAEGAEVRHRARSTYLTLVAEAKDARRPAQVESLATLLYGVQLAVVLFWLQDLSSQAHKTTELLEFIHEVFGRLRLLLRVPWIAQALARFVEIMVQCWGKRAEWPARLKKPIHATSRWRNYSPMGRSSVELG